MLPPYLSIAGFNKPYSQVMQWSGKSMKALGHMIVPVLAETLLYTSVNQRIPFTEGLLCINNLVYLPLMAHYLYHTEATIKYMENCLEEFHHQHKDAFSRFWASESSKKVSEALKTQLTFDKQEEWESDPASNNLSAAATRHHVEEDKTQIHSEIAQHLIEEAHFNFVKMHLLNPFSDHICQLGDLLNASSELSDTGMMDLKQAYWQSNHQEAAIQILWSTAQNEMFQYWVLYANAAKQCRDNEMPWTKVLIKHMVTNPTTGYQDPWWLGWVGCDAIRWATEWYCVGIREICWLHRLWRSRSVFQSSLWRKVHSVQPCRNFSDVLTMQWAGSSYGVFHWVHKVETAEATKKWYTASSD